MKGVDHRPLRHLRLYNLLSLWSKILILQLCCCSALILCHVIIYYTFLFGFLLGHLNPKNQIYSIFYSVLFGFQKSKSKKLNQISNFGLGFGSVQYLVFGYFPFPDLLNLSFSGFAKNSSSDIWNRNVERQPHLFYCCGAGLH